MITPFDRALRDIFYTLKVEKRTQKDFAETLGVSEKHIAQIHQGKADPTFKLARRMWDEAMGHNKK